MNLERLAQVKFSGISDQHPGKVLINSPVAHLVGVSQSIAGDLAANSHVVELLPGSSQTGLDISETFAIGELSKRHR
ncbi:hypothetical protein D3C83_22140 [compost metagenome]